MKPLTAIVGAAFIAAGAMHFVAPAAYVKIVPPPLPAKEMLVALSGVAEMAGGLGLLVAQTRLTAAKGLILVLIAVFPANVYMANDAERFAAFAPAWALYARLPLQAVLAGLVWAARR